MKKIELEIGNTLAGLLYFWTLLAIIWFIMEKIW